MIGEKELKEKLEELIFEKGNLQIELDKALKKERISDEKFSKITSRIDEIFSILKFCEDVVLKGSFGDWRDLPDKDYKQCEVCGKFFINVEKHKEKVHGFKGQTKLNSKDE